MFLTSLSMSSRPVFSLFSTGLWYLSSRDSLASISSMLASYLGHSSSIFSRKAMEVCTVLFSLFNSSDVLISSGEWFVFFLDFLALAGENSSLHTPSKNVMIPMNCEEILQLFLRIQLNKMLLI